MSLGRALRDLRQRAGLSHADVAARAGVLSRLALGRIERDLEAPGLDELAALATALGTTIPDLRAHAQAMQPIRVRTTIRGPWPHAKPNQGTNQEKATMTEPTSTPAPAPNAIPGVDALSALVAQREELDKQIQTMRAEQRANVLASIREAIALYGFTAEEMDVRRKPGRKPGNGAAAS